MCKRPCPVYAQMYASAPHAPHVAWFGVLAFVSISTGLSTDCSPIQYHRFKCMNPRRSRWITRLQQTYIYTGSARLFCVLFVYKMNSFEFYVIRCIAWSLTNVPRHVISTFLFISRKQHGIVNCSMIIISHGIHKAMTPSCMDKRSMNDIALANELRLFFMYTVLHAA